MNVWSNIYAIKRLYTIIILWYISEVPFAIEQRTTTEISNVKILIRVRHLGINLTFLSPFGLLKFQDFPSFLFILKLSYSKPFQST